MAAVNAAGQGPAAPATIDGGRRCPSRARSTSVQGKKGGKLTAGAKWKAPADAGGFAITKYKVAVFKKNGKKVDTKVVKADQLKFLVQAQAGQVLLQGGARNTDRWGPWSKKTDLVRPR